MWQGSPLSEIPVAPVWCYIMHYALIIRKAACRLTELGELPALVVQMVLRQEQTAECKGDAL